MKKALLISFLILLCVLMVVPPLPSTPRWITIDDFERGLTSRWEKRAFRGETRYGIVKMEGGHCLRAESRASASGLFYRIEYDVKDYPILTWRWKVEHVLKKGDAEKKGGDDYAARLYVVFPGFFPGWIRSINYIWANRLAKGKMVPNAYTSRNMMVAVESGEEFAGEWVQERRNVYEDYQACFGAKPPKVGAIAVMTDTDDTRETATAYYDDIRIGPGPF